jgi:hypothetical protein
MDEVAGSIPVTSTNFQFNDVRAERGGERPGGTGKVAGARRDRKKLPQKSRQPLPHTIAKEEIVSIQQWMYNPPYMERMGGSVVTVNQLAGGITWEKPADLSSREVQKRLSTPAIKVFLKIRELWDLRDEDARRLLGGISNGAFYDLKKKVRGTLDQDRLTRISILTGVFKALNILYGKKLADRWIQLPNENPMFEGESPLTYMIKGGLPAMMRVRQLLDSRRGGR